MNTQAVYEKQVNAMGKTLVPDVTKLMRPAAFALLGLLTSCFDALEGMSPFACALVASVPDEQCFAAFAGAGVGFLLSGDLLRTFRYIAVLVLIITGRLIYRRFGGESHVGAVRCISAAVFPLAVSIPTLVLRGFTLKGALIGLCEAAISSGACFFFYRSFTVPVLKIGIRRLNLKDTAFICACLCSVLLCACGVRVGDFRPAHILAYLAVLLASHYRGAAGGSIMGVCTGLSLSLSPGMGHMFMFCTLGGFMGGLFSSFGQAGVSIAFACTCGVLTLFQQGSRESLFALFEAGIACAAFAFVPPSLVMRLEDYFDKSGFTNEKTVNQEVALSLVQAAETVNEISDIVAQVSGKMDDMLNPQMSRICARIQQSVCRGCPQKPDCWGESFDETADDITRIASRLRTPGEGHLSITELEKRCPCGNELAVSVQNDYTAYVGGYNARLQISEMRGVVSDQFTGVSCLLRDVAERITGSRVYDYSKGAAIRQQLLRQKINAERVTFSQSANGRAVVEVTLYESLQSSEYRKIGHTVSKTVMRNFEQPEISIVDFQTTLTFPQRAVYDVKYGYSQLAVGENSVCGDSLECFSDMDDNAVCLISDGMGTGKRAAIDGTMTATLMKKLVISGFGFDTALQMVNSALLVKSSDESLATVDGLSVNIYTGSARFYKAGAAVSFVRSGNNVVCVEQQSLPVGILRQVGFAVCEHMLSKGDIVLMVSDGVTSGDCAWVTDELLSWSTDSMKELAAHITELARLRNGSENDDITAVALKLVAV